MYSLARACGNSSMASGGSVSGWTVAMAVILSLRNVVEFLVGQFSALVGISKMTQ